MMARKPFTMTAHLPSGDTVTFGIIGSRTWIRVDTADGETLSSLDQPGKATAVAVGLVHPDLWPAFATHLKPHVVAATLF